MEPGWKMPNHLIIYNLAMDLDSTVLASNFDWVEEIAKRFEKVTVFTTQLGRVKNLSNVEIFEIGGKSNLGRTKALYRLIEGFLRIARLKDKKYIFYHMSHKPATLLGLFYKLLRCKQVLWYSHSKSNFSLICAVKFVDYVVSSSSSTFPLNSKKFKPIGHGINVKKFISFEADKEFQSKRRGYIAVGRIVRIKKIEKMIESLSSGNRNLTLIGEIYDKEYFHDLKYLSTKKRVLLKHLKPISQDKLLTILANYRYIINCTPKSVDKSFLEGVISGLIPVSDNENALRLTGMDKIWTETMGIIPNLKVQIEKLELLSGEEIIKISKSVREYTIKNNNIEKAITSICRLLGLTEKDLNRENK